MAARLALIGPSWPVRGGIARTTTALAQALARRDTLSAFLVPTRQYPRWLYPGSRDTDAAACPRLNAARALFAVLEPWTWLRLLRELRAARPDAIVLPYWTWAWAPFERAVLAAHIAPAMAVVHNASDHDAGWVARGAARSVLGRCNAFLCHAQAVRDDLQIMFGEIPALVHPIPNIGTVEVDRTRARARFELRESDVAVLCFGLIRPYKGVDVLLEAFARGPAERGMTLLLAGEPWGKLGESIAERIARPDLVGRVKARLQWIPEDEAGDWFGAADVAVLPYRSATGSAVAAQALGYGLPVIGSNVGGLAEVVETGVNGLIVPPEDVGALAAALLALADPAVRVRFAAGARAASQRWSWDSYAATLEELVEGVRRR